MVTQRIKDLAAEREKCMASVKVLKALDNVSDVESVIQVLEDKIKSINEDLQKYIYCTNVDNEDVLKWLNDKVKYHMNEIESGDIILDYHVEHSIMFNKILNDLGSFYSLNERCYEGEPEVIEEQEHHYTEVIEAEHLMTEEEFVEILESLPDEEDHDEYVRMLADDLPNQNQEPNCLVKETDPDED